MAQTKEKPIGKVVHYFTEIKVAAIELSDALKVGDTVHIKGHTTDLNQKIDSMQIDKESIESAKKGESIGIKVDDHVREGDEVFLVE
jgi:putative protease